MIKGEKKMKKITFVMESGDIDKIVVESDCVTIYRDGDCVMKLLHEELDLAFDCLHCTEDLIK